MGSSSAEREALGLLCGTLIGQGMSRSVYNCDILPGSVVKVETTAGRFQNIIEWETWQMVSGTPASRWFAACQWISPSGVILIQERTITPHPDDYVDKVPVWFTDLKKSNWGMSALRKDRLWLVCHDYGTSRMLQEGTITKRTKKADWYDE